MFKLLTQFAPRAHWPGSNGSALLKQTNLCAIDTLADPVDDLADARAMLRGLHWSCSQFAVGYHTDAGWCDAQLSFPSPLPQGDELNDRVVLDWHAARDDGGHPTFGPGMLVLDILQGGNFVASAIARMFAANGIHGFVMHMPRNGQRRPPGTQYDWGSFLPALRQACADARRARDVIAVLPNVSNHIGVQGTSLGGFVATVAAGIDAAFDTVILSLAGGNVFRVLAEGRLDAARVRGYLRDQGFDDQRLREELWRMEPLRIAHRLHPSHTWLYSARRDQVVPAAYSNALAAAIRLPASHHRKMSGCHYSCALVAPWALGEIVNIVKDQDRAGTRITHQARAVS